MAAPGVAAQRHEMSANLCTAGAGGGPAWFGDMSGDCMKTTPQTIGILICLHTDSCGNIAEFTDYKGTAKDLIFRCGDTDYYLHEISCRTRMI